MSKPKIIVTSLIILLIVSLSAIYVAAQYTTEKTTNINISSNGTFIASEPSLGITYIIQGTPGTTGTVTASIYSGNPQTTADVPDGITLTHFIAVTFSMDANDFNQATITISYSDSDVQNLQTPYAVYKYLPNSNSYIELPATFDTNAKTYTVTLTSTTDPLLAIGAPTNTSNPNQTSTWIIIIVSIIIILLATVFTITYLRKSDKSGEPKSEQNTDAPPKTQPPSNSAQNNPQTTKSEENQVHDEYWALRQSLKNDEKKPQDSNTEQDFNFAPKGSTSPNNAKANPPNINGERKNQTANSKKQKNHR